MIDIEEIFETDKTARLISPRYGSYELPFIALQTGNLMIYGPKFFDERIIIMTTLNSMIHRGLLQSITENGIESYMYYSDLAFDNVMKEIKQDNMNTYIEVYRCMQVPLKSKGVFLRLDWYSLLKGIPTIKRRKELIVDFFMGTQLVKHK